MSRIADERKAANPNAASLFAPFFLRRGLDAFDPAETTPWDRVTVDTILEHEYQRTRTEILGGATVDRIESVVAWVRNQGLGEGATILDVGCGPGLYSHRLAEAGCRVTGIDISDDFLTFARQRATEGNVPCAYRKMSALEIELPCVFDMVLVTQGPSLHLTREQLPYFTRSLTRLLRPGGHLVCEFSIEPEGLQRRAPSESFSAWFTSDTFAGRILRAQAIRQLSFPADRERVHHRILLYADGDFEEWWSRFALHSYDELARATEGAGLVVNAVFGPTIGEPYTDDQMTCHFWLTLRRSRRGP